MYDRPLLVFNVLIELHKHEQLTITQLIYYFGNTFYYIFSEKNYSNIHFNFNVFINSRAMFWGFFRAYSTSEFYWDRELFALKYDAVNQNFILCYKCHLKNIKHNFMFIPSFRRYIIVISILQLLYFAYFNFSTYYELCITAEHV